MEVSLIDVSTLIADSVWDVECEIVTSLDCSDVQQLFVLLLGEMLVEVHV